jgi:muconolactone delta-isomerase
MAALGTGRAELVLHLLTREDAVQYLVTMTTRVPDGTSAREVDEVRSREAVRSRQLAAEGHLLRLWRPPARPGEWRTLGLFEAKDGAGLEELLASMPLRVWRSDEVTPLTPHPNDPGVDGELRGGDAEFVITFDVAVPQGTSNEALEEATAREAMRSRQLAGEGHLVRLWALPGRGRVLGLYRAHDLAEMEAIVEALPLKPMMTTEIAPLALHPNDPAIGGPATDAENSAFAEPPGP